MSDHDQLCPCYGNPLPDFCECSPIAKARADERERIARAIEAEMEICRATPYGRHPQITHSTHYAALHYAARIARGEWGQR